MRSLQEILEVIEVMLPFLYVLRGYSINYGMKLSETLVLEDSPHAKTGVFSFEGSFECSVQISGKEPSRSIILKFQGTGE